MQEMQLDSETLITLVALVAGAAVMTWMYRLEKRPRQALEPRLIPTTLIMLLGLLITIGAAVHLAGLMGLKIPQRGP
jgi:hypothetical protein